MTQTKKSASFVAIGAFHFFQLYFLVSFTYFPFSRLRSLKRNEHKKRNEKKKQGQKTKGGGE